MALLTGGKVIVFEKKIRDELHERGFGELKNKTLTLELLEALYLAEKEKLVVTDENQKTITVESLIALGTRERKDFYDQFVVYQSFRDRGYSIKTGFKFGFDFRVNPRGQKAGQAHSEMVVHVFSDRAKLGTKDFSRLVRMSQTLRTKSVIAVVDAEDEVNFYAVERLTP